MERTLHARRSVASASRWWRVVPRRRVPSIASISGAHSIDQRSLARFYSLRFTPAESPGPPNGALPGCCGCHENMRVNDVDEFLSRLGGSDLIAWHRTNGAHRSAVDYLKLHRDLLVRGLSGTRLLYLDTNYWVRLRDAAIGRGTPESINLLQTLRAMVRSREALCVSQLYSLLEVSRQGETSLRASADLIDELTEGVAIACPSDLLRWECAEFIKASLDRDVGKDLCPWTKVGQIHESELPIEMPGPTSPADREVLLKGTVDACWNMSFEYVFKQFDWDTKTKLNADLDPETFSRVAKRKADQLAKGLTRDQVRQAEFSEMANSQLKPIFIALLRQWHVERRFPEGVAALPRDVLTAEALAVKKFADRSLGRLLPGLAIPTELYVLYETNKQSSSPLTTNDWFDWSHAAVALPYCSVFLTERGLAHRLQRELKADVQYDCEVIGTLEEAVAHLHTAS
jgi:hypothetical protein